MRRWLCRLGGGAVSVWMAAAACMAPTASAALAEDADAIAKTIDTTLSAAQRSAVNGKHKEAIEALTKVGPLMAELKAANPNHKSLKILQGKFERLTTDVERRAGKLTGTPTTDEPQPVAPSAAGAAKSPPTVATASDDKLPSGVDRRLKMIRKALNGDRTVRETAEALMADIEKQFAGQYSPDHPDIVEVKKLLAARQASKAEGEQAKAAAAEQATRDEAEQEATCKPWIAKLTPYVIQYDTVNKRPNPKHLVATTSQDVEELKRLKAVYDEAKAAFDEYRKADLPKGKTRELKALEEDLAQRLTGFAKEHETNVGRVLENSAKPLDDAMAELEKDTKWHDDPKAIPMVVSARDMDAFRDKIDRAAKLDPNSPKIAELRGKLAALARLNDERRTVKASRTLMIGDRFTGGDLKELKAKANEVVKEKLGDATPLRTTIVSQDWKEDDVAEWTDTTQTAARRRITRGVSAQVAVKQADGVFLHTVHLAKDRRTDGSWGPLYGHIMFTDAMLEENVKKDAR